MAVLSSDLFQLGMVKLVNGSVPATPAFKRARLSSESLGYTPQTSPSSELDPLGQLRDSVLLGARSAGSVDMPLSMHDFFDEALAAVMRGSWSSNTLVVGTTLSEYCVEKRFVDPVTAGQYIYHRFPKCAVNSVSVAVSPGNEVTASVDMVGGSAEFSEAIITGATYPDPGTKPVFTSPLVTEVSIAGSTNTLCFSNITLEFNSNVRGVECIGTLGVKEYALGRFEAAIRGTVYFTSNDLLDYLISQATFAVALEIKDALNNKYKFSFPKCKLSSGTANATGTNQDVISNLVIQALYDTATSTTVTVTRTVVV